MKVCFLVPDGTGIRNYLYSKLLSELPKGTEILLWHNISEKAIIEVQQLHTEIDIRHERIPVYVEHIRERILREASTFARLHWSANVFENKTIVSNWYKPRKTLKRKILYKVAEFVGNRAKHSYQKIRKLEQKHTELIAKPETLKPYIDFLTLYKPDIIFCTHQRVPWLMPAIEAAKILKIKTVTAIYSWDNLPKARLPLRTDKFVVWSKHMKEELNLFYPEIPLDDIEITGSPQFEFYKDDSRIWSREKFAAKYSLDPKKRFICYSGDDTDISPYDPHYLNDLAEAVETIDKPIRPHIIFRRSPADFTDRYDVVLKKHSDVITSIDPLWKCDDSGKEWTTFYPLPADVDLLVNLVKHSDMSINIASTIAHDYATFDKPTCYINYNQAFSSGWSVKIIYQFQHFRSMGKYKAVGWINSKAEIKDMVVNSINRPSSIGPDRISWLNKIVTEDYEKASTRIALILTTLYNERSNKKISLENTWRQVL